MRRSMRVLSRIAAAPAEWPGRVETRRSTSGSGLRASAAAASVETGAPSQSIRRLPARRARAAAAATMRSAPPPESGSAGGAPEPQRLGALEHDCGGDRLGAAVQEVEAAEPAPREL